MHISAGIVGWIVLAVMLAFWLGPILKRNARRYPKA